MDGMVNPHTRTNPYHAWRKRADNCIAALQHTRRIQQDEQQPRQLHGPGLPARPVARPEKNLLHTSNMRAGIRAGQKQAIAAR